MIVLSGPIGAGKTSLTDLLSNHLGSKSHYESVDDNPILPLFYADQKKYAFLLQIYFLNKRLDIIKNAQESILDVSDRSIYEDELFFSFITERGGASEIELDIYRKLLTNMLDELGESPSKKPALMVHIKVSFETMLKRIEKRARPYEQLDFDPNLYEYYKQLNDRYDQWYEEYNHSPKMLIDGDKYDFVEDESSRLIVLNQIDEKLKELNLL